MNPTNKPTHALDRIQRWMQAAVMHPDGVVEGMQFRRGAAPRSTPARAEEVVTRSKALTAVERLAIYGNAYYARLLECLREEFPATAHALGEDTFDAFAAAYLQNYPSRSYTLCRLGANFPRFLTETRPPREEGEPEVSWPEFLADLAAFEWTFSEVFDGPGVEGGRGGVTRVLLDEAKVRAVPPERWPEARLAAVPCLRLLALRFPVQDYYAEVRAEKSPSLPRAGRDAPGPGAAALRRPPLPVVRPGISSVERPGRGASPWGRRSRRRRGRRAPTWRHLAANLHALVPALGGAGVLPRRWSCPA